jgi:hypothetical protein
MPHELRAPLYFTLGFFLALVLAATASVYGFRVYERAWGMGGSWQVLLWIATGSTVLALLSVMYIYRFARRQGRTMARPRALLVGGASALALIGIVALLPEQTKDFGLWPVAALSVVLPALSIFLLSAPANRAAHTDARGASQVSSPSQSRAGGRER